MTIALQHSPSSDPCEFQGSQVATECYNGLTLRPKQGTALSALVMGLSDEAAAEVAGVHRVTVTRWRLHDRAFQTAFLARLADLWAMEANHLRALVPKAIDTLHALLETGSEQTQLRAAVEILRLSRILAADRAAQQCP